MAEWTHAICADCWAEQNPDRVAVQVMPEYRYPFPCCFCGRSQTDGIYVRHDPADPKLYCSGDHEVS